MDGQMEPVDRWNRWTEVNRWTDGMDGQMVQVDRHEQVDGQMEWMDRWYR